MKNPLKENHSFILFGCGNSSKEFYKMYGDQLDIVAFMSNTGDIVFSPNGKKQYEVLRPVPKRKNKNRTFIIICSVSEKEISEQLILLGYRPFEDFIDMQTAILMMSNKKIALLYGACHLRAIRDALANCDQFSEIYDAFYISNYLMMDIYTTERLMYMVNNCDVFIYGYSVEEHDYRKNQMLLMNLREDAAILTVPIILWNGYFPQVKRPFNRMNQYAVKCEGWDYTPFSYEDSYINQCIDEGLIVKEIVRRIMKTSVYDSEMIHQMIEQEWKRLIFQEKETGVEVCEYVRKFFQKRRLFRNEAHPENEIIYHYVFQILKKLGIAFSYEVQKTSFFICSQHPIYPCTANALGLEWDVENEKLDLYTYRGFKQVTIQEYLEAYIESCTKIKELKERALLPQ